MSSAPAADLSAFLHTLATAHSSAPAVIGERDLLSFAELDQRADQWAAAFTAAGYGRDAHVGLLAANNPEWLAIAFGVWRAGATLVPISTFVTASELAGTLEHADIGVLVVQSRLRSHDYLESLRQATDPHSREVIVLADDAPTPYHRAADFLRQARSRTFPPPDPESIACILYTSGTTGEPKGVMLSHRAMLATIVPTAERSGLTAADTLLSTLPLFWVAGLVIRALPTLATGCALAVLEAFTVEALLDALRRRRITALHLRPPQVSQLRAHPEFDPRLLARVHRGGGRADWYAPHLDADHARLITGYGMTEMAGYVTALNWQDCADVRRMQIGTPLPGVELRIVDNDGRICSAGAVGEIRVRGPGMFTDYYKQAPATGMDADGFFMTGDLGRVDASGIFHFVGRTKDLLRVKGINVSPVEVESVLAMHPAVDATYIVGLPPAGLEQRVVALIIAKPGEHPTADELKRFAGERLSRYKQPAQYLFVGREDVPLSGTVKPQRAALAELAMKLVGPV